MWETGTGDGGWATDDGQTAVFYRRPSPVPRPRQFRIRS
jgi:hypothetical protein